MEKTIPSREEEVPVSQVLGNVLKHPATHCRIEHLWPSAKDDELPPKDRASIEVYLANFSNPIRTIANQVRCNSCGEELRSPSRIINPFVKTLTLSPTGDSKCPSCSYPVRHEHKITNLETGKLLVHLDFFPMCYHPSALQIKI